MQKAAPAALGGKTGALTAVAPSAGNRGPVGSRNFKLQYADGSPHVSVGTTSYQWASKGFAMQNQTLATLRDGPASAPGGAVFNKMRMTVFPKW
jgi:hypothetical protein